jgi:beta-glucanase (GH16 family)
VDSLGSRNTGLALVHSPIPGAAENTPAQLTFRLYDSSYQLLGTVSRTLDPGSQIAQFVNEIFGADPTVSALAAEMRGSLEVEAEGASVAAVTLRQLQTSQAFPGQVPTLTTFPVVIPAPATPEWQLVWSDEFDGDSLDLSKWEYEIGRGPQNDGWGNRELQYYTNRAENLRVADGTLKIIATNDPYRVTIGNNSTTYTYTSARIRTKDKGDWKYGRFEFRAKLPEGKGIWPAIWMLPTDNVYGTWAASGEIDIMEMVGHEPNRVHGTLHYGGMWPNNIYDGMSYRLREGKFSESFHDFALEWEDGEMRWYVDGVLYVRQTWWKTAGHPFPAPFDQRFHLLINMAVGGNWPGSPDATTQFPQKLEVDYVRVYQRTPAD